MARTTKEEFHDAIPLVIACRASITCGVYLSEDDKLQADWLYYQCKRYCEEYKDFLNKEL